MGPSFFFFFCATMGTGIHADSHTVLPYQLSYNFCTLFDAYKHNAGSLYEGLIFYERVDLFISTAHLLPLKMHLF